MQVSLALVDRADFLDHFSIHICILTTASSIRTARKRKLRELYSVATDSNAAPNPTSGDGNATSTLPPELSFLLDSELLR